VIAPALGVIPARIGSSRLPRKPLYPLAGRPLIEWVWQRVMEADVFTSVVIATDSEEVGRVARAFGAEVELTDGAHPTGTDRVAEVARLQRYRDFPLIINVQGDEPFVRASDLRSASRLVEAGWGVGTVATRIESAAELHDPAVVKVVRGGNGGALYFSRAPIPFGRDVEPGSEDFSSGSYLRHIGLYAYSRDSLLRWVSLPEADLERVERLEQLRPLAAGIRIGVALVPAVEGGVDTPADAQRAELRLLSPSPSGAFDNL
jgi:3-deoxy-manno-octulosonate cytidylyltransferase (CMP-KDO synthetase)